MANLDRLIVERGFLLADGATGTNLFEMGLQTGDAPEPWNVEHPDRIKLLHQGFVDAGSDIILTNTFGGNLHRLKLHGNESRVHELNVAAGKVAREVADTADRAILVAGSMGPTGELFKPIGVNPDKVSLAISLALRFIPVLGRITTEVREAQKARGLERSVIAVAMPLAIRAIKMADDISDAIDSRGYRP